MMVMKSKCLYVQIHALSTSLIWSFKVNQSVIVVLACP